jgi:membrane protease YdiL (CAAX protease family)
MDNNKTKRIIADIFMICLLIIFPHLGLLPMYAFSVLLIALIWFYLRFFNEKLNDIGFRFFDFNFRAFWLGGIIGIGYAVFAFWVIGPLVKWIGLKQADVSDFNYIRHNPFNLLFLLAIACFLVIPFEELVFRGFIFTRIKAMVNNKYAFAVSGLITSILFALYHYQEGAGAVVIIFIFALFITWLYRLFGGNLWYLIFFHIFYDIFMLTAIYLGYM